MIDLHKLSDRELLELAARAAGYVIEWCPQWCGGSGGYMKTVIPTPVDPVLSTSLHWNPLVDDGDALRLACSLSADIFIHQATVEVEVGNVKITKELNGLKKPEATCRAITLAAASVALAKRGAA